MDFVYDATFVAAAKVCKSRPRLGSYLAAAAGNDGHALQLHTWNTAISAAFYGPLQTLEIALRNAYDRALQRQFGASWWTDPRFLVSSFIEDKINEAVEDLTKLGKAVDTPHVVAALSFGFWVGISGRGARNRHANEIWIPALRKAFDNKISLGRTKVYDQLDAIRLLRNRIAHHEPIFQRDLQADYESVRQVLTWLNSEMIPWMDHHSRIGELLAARPIAVKF